MIQTKTNAELVNALRALYDQMLDAVRGNEEYNTQLQDLNEEIEPLGHEEEMDIHRIAVLLQLMNICVRESYSGQKSRILQTLATVMQEELSHLSNEVALDMLSDMFRTEAGNDQPLA